MNDDAKETALTALKAAGASLLRHQVANDALPFSGEKPESGNDVYTSLRYHVARDNGLGDLLQGGKTSNVITKDDVENILTDIATRYKGLTEAQLQQVRSKLEGSIGASRENLGELHQRAENVATEYPADNAQQNLTPPQQEVRKLWVEFDACEKEMQDEFEKLYRSGKISYEQMQYLRTERTRLDGLPKDSEERITGEKAFAEHQKELGIEVRDKAHKDGDQATEQSADKLAHQADEQAKRLEELHKLQAEGQAAMQQKIGQAKGNMHMSDDEPPITINTPKENQGMEVMHATLDDVQGPTGGKDRSSNRTVTKT